MEVFSAFRFFALNATNHQIVYFYYAKQATVLWLLHFLHYFQFYSVDMFCGMKEKCIIFLPLSVI